MWSLGVICFMTLFGTSPFSDLPNSPAPAKSHLAPEAVGPDSDDGGYDSDAEAAGGSGGDSGGEKSGGDEKPSIGQNELVGASWAASTHSAPPLRRPTQLSAIVTPPPVDER